MSKLVEIKVPDIGDFESVEVIEVMVAVGDTVEAGAPLFTLSANDESRFARALESLEGAWEIGDTAAGRGPLVRERITA